MITSTYNFKICKTDGCLYKLCSRVDCQRIIDNINYCSNCVEASKSLDDANVSDNDRLEHKFNKEYNDDCVSVFQKTGDNDEVEYSTKTIINIACNTVVDELLDFIETIPDAIAFLDPDVLESIRSYLSNVTGSDHSNESDDIFDCESLNENTKQFFIFYLTSPFNEIISIFE